MLCELGRTGAPIPRVGDYRDGDYFQTDFGPFIYHSQVATVANDTWLEVQHALFETETEAMWFTRARGSGIWCACTAAKLRPDAQSIRASSRCARTGSLCDV